MKPNLKTWSLYLGFLVCIGFAFVSYQLSLASFENLPRVWVYVAGIYGYYAFFIAILFLAIWIFGKIFRPLFWLLPLFGSIFSFYLIADALIFDMYGFHLDLLLLKMFIFDFKGMGLPNFILFLILFVGFVAIALHFGFVYFLLRFAPKPSFKGIALSTFVLFVLLLLNSAVSVWANHYQRSEILTFKRYLPLYYPLLSYEHGPMLSKLFPSFLPPKYGKKDIQAKLSGEVFYPKKTLLCKVKHKPNIILIVLESWQSQTLNPTVMPKLYERIKKKGGRLYTNHLSNGSVTVAGLFSIFTGAYASYHKSFSSNPNKNSSVLVNFLHENDYEIKAFSESNLERFSLRPIILPFGKYFKTSSDEKSFQKLKENMPSKKPFFNFIFYTSSHSSYDYPSSFAKFKPLPKLEGGFAIDKQSSNIPYKNDYKNSLLYMDDMIERTLKLYEKNGLLDDTYIIITGDHAEEFNENKKGFWGHGSNFTKYQTNVPFVFISPTDKKMLTIQNRSYHVDLTPTLMQEVFACTNPLSDYTNGQNLLHLPASTDSIISSYYEDAYIIDNVIYEKNIGRTYRWEDFVGLENSLPNAQKYKKLIKKQQNFYLKE